MKRFLLTILLIASAVSVQASEPRFGYWDSNHPHSVSASIGSYPLLLGYTQSQTFNWGAYDGEPFHAQEPRLYYHSRRVSSPLFNLSYTYRASKLISFSCNLSYATEATKYSGYYNDEYAFTSRDNVFLVTPMVRLHWLNSRHIELYSAFGCGLGYSHSTNYDGVPDDNRETTGTSLQFTSLGIVGKFNRTFIFSEFGPGTLGCIRVGAGYRF